MTLFKKIFLTLSLFVCFIGCSGGKNRGGSLRDWMQDSKEIKVLCTTAQVGDLVKAIGGDRVKTWVLIEGDLDPHSYELVKGDDEKLTVADIVFYNGLNLEHGVSLSESLRLSPNAVAVGDAIAQRHPDKILRRESIVDPHLWMDISTWRFAINPILEKLSAMDPEGTPYYEERALDLARSMEQAHLDIKEKLKTIPEEKRYLLTSHDAFRYFTRAYLAVDGETNWSDRFAAPEGLAPDGQLSPVDIQRMIAFVKAYRISVVFPESNVSRDSIKKIASAGKELGLDIRVCQETLYGDSMSGLSYFDMMGKNADILSRYLTP